MITVKDLFKSGTGSTVVVAPADTVYRALQLMAENNVGSVVVSDGGHMVGIFTERDYCRKIIMMGRSSLNTPIGEIMTKNMITVRPNQTLEECLELMSKYHIRHLRPPLGAGRPRRRLPLRAPPLVQPPDPRWPLVVRARRVDHRRHRPTPPGHRSRPLILCRLPLHGASESGSPLV